MCDAAYPTFDGQYLVESSFEYPVSINGKMRFKREFALDMDVKEIEQAIAADAQTVKYVEGKAVKKIIVVKGKIINVVC